MEMMMRLLYVFAVLSMLISCGPQLKPVSEQRNLIPGELPDPSIIEVDGTYYLTGSSNDWGPVYPIYQSTDLKNWSFVTYVFAEQPSWTINSFWAPELYYRDGKFYCYYTARRTDGVSGIGVAVTDDITKGFEDKGQIIEWGSEAIDAFVYEDQDKLYITWKAYGLNPDKPITILGSELSEDGLSLKGAVFTVLEADADGWERGGIEGQCIVKKGDYLYMLYSGNACCGSGCDYMVGVARSKSMLGPWEKYVANPLLQGNAQWKCPGHGTDVEVNENWQYVYHAYSSEGFPNMGRTNLISQINWDSSSEWPYIDIPNDSTEVKLVTTVFRDEFDDETINYRWRYDIPSKHFTASLDSGTLHLSETGEGNNLSGSSLVIDPQAADFTMQTTISQQSKSLKGLILYVTKSNNLGFGVAGDSLIVWKVKDGEFNELERIAAKTFSKIDLKADVVDVQEIMFSYKLDNDEWQTIKTAVSGDNLAWWSWGMKAGVFIKGADHNGEGAFDEFSISYH